MNDNQSINTIKFMAKIEEQICHISEKLKAMPTRDEMLLANEQLVDRIFEKGNRKYASKLVEIIVYTSLGVVGLYLINKALELI